MQKNLIEVQFQISLYNLLQDRVHIYAKSVTFVFELIIIIIVYSHLDLNALLNSRVVQLYKSIFNSIYIILYLSWEFLKYKKLLSKRLQVEKYKSIFVSSNKNVIFAIKFKNERTTFIAKQLCFVIEFAI